MSGPTYAALVNLADAVRKDDGARQNLERLITYLLDAASKNDAQGTSLASAIDVLQVLEDDTNLTPLERVLANVVSPTIVGEDGSVKKRGMAGAGINVLSRIFERSAQERPARAPARA